MHTIQLNPAIRFIGNTKSGWQPYASVGMVWNLLNETNAKANGVVLPKMHTKPYIEYGVGLQKHWNDKFSAFGQAMVRNGGRNGVALTAGFRWALGEKKAPETVEVKEVKTKKAHKPVQKVVLPATDVEKAGALQEGKALTGADNSVILNSFQNLTTVESNDSKMLKPRANGGSGQHDMKDDKALTGCAMQETDSKLTGEHVLIQTNTLSKAEIAVRTANLNKYKQLTK